MSPISFGPIHPRHFSSQQIKRLVCAFTLLISVQGGWFINWAQADSVIPKVETYTLPTGQTLYIKEDHSQPIVTIDTWVKTGSVNETDKINGVSHFLEHLLFKGTQQYKPGVIDRLLESRGSQFNAATSDDFTHYYITTATPYFKETLKLHADMLLNAAIPASELPQERKVVQEEINRANDNPDRQLYTELAKLMYGQHGYAYDTLGPKETIATISRDSILEYYHYWYQPQNFNTIIVGDVNPEEAKKLVTEAFPKPPFLTPKNYQAPQVGLVQPPSSPQAKVLENPSITQAYFALGFLGPAQQKPDDVYALDIALLALGSGKSSRLYQALRETKPLANSVSAGNYTQKYSGLIVINAEAKPENREVVKQEILKQLKQLKANGITQAELTKAKNQYIKDFVFENESTDGTASSIGYNVTIGSLQDYLDHVSNVEKVTLDQVKDALNRYLNFNQAVMVELLPSSLKANLKAESGADLALLQTAESFPIVPSALTAQTTQADETNSVIEKKTLSNGMTLISKPRKNSATVAVKLFIKGGQGVETIPGTAGLVSALMMQGTPSRTAEAINRELESKGMSLTVSADDDFIEITGSAIREDLGELFAVLKDVLRNPLFAPDEISKKKEQIHQALAASRDNPSSLAFENLTTALYPHHPYGNEGKRVEDSLDTISRQDLLDYYHLYFVPQNMVASVVGNFDQATLQNYLTSLYDSCTGCQRSLVSTPPVPALTDSRTLTEEKPKLSATWLAQGWLVPPIRDQKDYVALKVLNSLLGTGMSSRLFVDLREKQGLAYVVGSMLPSREEKSRFVAYIGTDPANLSKVQNGFNHEITRLQNELVPDSELSEAKSKLRGSFFLAHNTNINQAYYLGFYEVVGTGYEFDKTYPALIEQVTPQDIQRVAKMVFSGPSVLSVVKPTAITPSPARK
jgi:zinc protease